MSDFDPTTADTVDSAVLRRFVAVGEELHFARAAKALHIARQSLSRTVIDLENELGTRVFEPGASPTRLTDDGRALLDYARARLAAETRAGQETVSAGAASLRVGFVPGVTVSKWSRIWADRLPEHPLEIVGITQADQDAALRAGRVDVCFVRLPIDRDGVHAISLYRETPVAVVRKEDELSLLTEVTDADLDGEIVQPTGDLDRAADTLALVAAVGGAVVVPMSIARLHHRRDLVYRTRIGVPDTEIALAWLAGGTADPELVEEFVGIVRGRSANSSRGSAEPVPKKAAAPRAGGSGKKTGARVTAKKAAPQRNKQGRGRSGRR